MESAADSKESGDTAKSQVQDEMRVLSRQHALTVEYSAHPGGVVDKGERSPCASQVSTGRGTGACQLRHPGRPELKGALKCGAQCGLGRESVVCSHASWTRDPVAEGESLRVLQRGFCRDWA